MQEHLSLSVFRTKERETEKSSVPWTSQGMGTDRQLFTVKRSRRWVPTESCHRLPPAQGGILTP